MSPGLRAIALLVAFAAITLTVPAWWCGVLAERVVAGDSRPLLALAERVARRAEDGRLDVQTGRARFDGECAQARA